MCSGVYMHVIDTLNVIDIDIDVIRHCDNEHRHLSLSMCVTDVVT